MGTPLIYIMILLTLIMHAKAAAQPPKMTHTAPALLASVSEMTLTPQAMIRLLFKSPGICSSACQNQRSVSSFGCEHPQYGPEKTRIKMP